MLRQNFSAVAHTVRALGYDFACFELPDFVQHVAKLCGTDILLLRYPFSPELHGLWIPAATAHYVFVNATLHPVHQLHIVLHELAHIVLDHPRTPLHEVVPAGLLETFRRPEREGRVRRGPGGATALSAEEREAEEFVFLVQQQVTRARRLHELVGSGSSIESLLPLMNIVAV